MAKFVIQPHVRLQEWVAEELGFFRDEGLDYEFQTDGFSGKSLTTSSIKMTDDAASTVQSGAFEDMSAGRSCDVSSACHWAVNAAAATQHGRMYGHAYSLSPAGIFVAPESPYQRPEDLAGVEVAVGYHSGSHYSAIQGLERFLQRDQINLRFAGTPHDRTRQLLARAVPAANLFGAQFYIAEQLGFHKIVDTTFMMGFLLSSHTDMEDTEKYFRALRRAQQELDIEPEPYKHYYARELPADLLERVDVRRFGPGERIVFESYTRETYERTQRWMQLWNLLTPEQAAQSRFEEAVLV
jgi:ABC-type nitrate/sulfonate/bicarbonate transport system substrate-binding protein